MKISPRLVVITLTSLLLNAAAPAARAQVASRPAAPVAGTAAVQVAALAVVSTTPAAASAPTPSRQDPAALRPLVEQFLQVQSAGLPGQASVEIGAIDPRLNLPACPQPEAFLKPGSRAWGRTTIGVRCLAPSAWTIYVTATVHVMADYLAAAAPLAQGQVIGTNDIARRRGDLTMLPAGVITDAGMAVGRTTMSSLQAGAPLRTDTLRAQAALQMGQTVKVLSSGPGFKVSTEARALNNAAEGQTAQARTLNGQLVSGIARAGGVLEVGF